MSCLMRFIWKLTTKNQWKYFTIALVAWNKAARKGQHCNNCTKKCIQIILLGNRRGKIV